LTGRKVQEFRFEDVAEVTVEQGEDSDGGVVIRPVARLRSGPTILLSQLWSHDSEGVFAAAREFARTCGLTLPRNLEGSKNKS
jgi:hypothetical protein